MASVAVATQTAAIPAALDAQAPARGTALVSRLSWLSGCWQRRNGTRLVEEQWMVPRGGVMMGMSRTVRGDTLVEYEQLRIFERPGRAVYAAAPSGQPMAEFETRATSDTLVVFENPTHDYPQRIIYRKKGNDSLLARIEGTTGGQVRGTDFPFSRAACLTASPPAAPDRPPTTADLLQALYDDFSGQVSANFSASTRWYVDNSVPTFTYVFWTTTLTVAPVTSRDGMLRTLERAATTPPTAGTGIRDSRYQATVEQVLARGDTTDVLLAIRHTWTFADARGQYGAQGKDHARRYAGRRLDSWVRAEGNWRLLRAQVIHEEVFVDEKLTTRNNRPVGNPGS